MDRMNGNRLIALKTVIGLSLPLNKILRVLDARALHPSIVPLPTVI